MAIKKIQFKIQVLKCEKYGCYRNLFQKHQSLWKVNSTDEALQKSM